MNKRLILSVLTVLFAAGMTACAVLLKEPEILFPEAAALCAGAWLAPRQPWRVTRRQMVLLMTASAVGGVLIVRYLPLPLPLRTAAGLLYTGALLVVSGSTLVPLISACILPVFLGTESWIYPLAVLLLTSCIAGGQALLTRTGLRQDSALAEMPPLAARLRRWSWTMAALLAFCLIPTALGRVYFCAPPLLVTFAELLSPNGALRQTPWRVWILCTGGAGIGLGVRLLNLYAGLPLVLCAALAVTLVLLLFRWVGRMLPPAAAASLLPLLLPVRGIGLYVPLLSAGAAVITLSAWAFHTYIRPEKRA